MRTRPWVFPHVDLQMCFVPQHRAIDPDPIFQNVRGHAVFCTFWLKNVLLATAACHYSFLCSTATSAPAVLRAYFSNIRNHESLKAQRFATFLTFGACVSSFLWLFLRVDLQPTDLTICVLSFFRLTWLLCHSAFQRSILSEVRLLNFLRSKQHKHANRPTSRSHSSDSMPLKQKTTFSSHNKYLFRTESKYSQCVFTYIHFFYIHTMCMNIRSLRRIRYKHYRILSEESLKHILSWNIPSSVFYIPYMISYSLRRIPQKHPLMRQLINIIIYIDMCTNICKYITHYSQNNPFNKASSHDRYLWKCSLMNMWRIS